MGLFEKVYEAVRKIPKGYVASYGMVAAAIGAPRCARQVGWALHINPDPDTIPCHRVVTRDGLCASAFAFGGEGTQRALLLAEGVTFENGRVNKKHFAKSLCDGD